MIKYEAGFIGAGNMGGALALAAAKRVGGAKVAVACSSAASTAAAAKRIGCTASTAGEILAESRFVFFGVKPNKINGLVRALAREISASDAVFVSMLAGVTLSRLSSLLGENRKVIRIMPNMACSVGKGIILLSANESVTEEELAVFHELMDASGVIDAVDEGLIDGAATVSGCGSAWAYMFAEALADGAVKCGVPRAKALEYTALMLSGAAEMMLSSGKHPEQLKDEVCSPGGNTIAGVYALERGGLRAACISAVEAAYERTKDLG